MSTTKNDVPQDLSQSFCDTDTCRDGTNCSAANVTFNCCSDGTECPDETKCSDGVCPMPKKSDDSKSSSPSKRKMRPPGETGSPGVPQLDQLFSQLFSSVLGNDDSPSNPLAAWESMIRKNPRISQSSDNSDEDTDEDSDEDDRDYSDEDGEHGENCDREECQTDNAEQFDPRWDTINKLIESHVNLTRAVSDLTRKR